MYVYVYIFIYVYIYIHITKKMYMYSIMYFCMYSWPAMVGPNFPAAQANQTKTNKYVYIHICNMCIYIYICECTWPVYYTPLLI